MRVQAIEQEFKNKVCAAIRVEPEGIDRFRVFSPFIFEDGDNLAIVLRLQEGQWVFGDEGHTFMHLSYDLEERYLQQGTRARVIANALAAFAVEDRDGELILRVPDGKFGDALYSFIQALLKIADVTYLTQERVRSTFMEDFQAFVAEHVPEEHRIFDWRDAVHDPEGMYAVDCRINHRDQPLLVYALPNDDKVRDVTIALLQFEKWYARPQHTVAVFENQEDINRKVLARFSDVCEKQFSTLAANKDRIARYLEESLA